MQEKLIKEAHEATGADRSTVARWLAGIKCRGAAGRALDAFFAKRGIAQPAAISFVQPPTDDTEAGTPKA